MPACGFFRRGFHNQICNMTIIEYAIKIDILDVCSEEADLQVN